MSFDAIVRVIGWIGTLYLLLCSMYMIPTIRSLKERLATGRTPNVAPPGVIGLVYTALTLFGLLAGMWLLSVTPLQQLLERYLQQVFLDGARAARIQFTTLAAFISFSFVIGNLARSYFNLHRIESPPPGDDTLACYIGALPRASASFEVGLRFAMVTAMVGLERLLHSMNIAGQASSGALAASEVDLFAHTLAVFWHVGLLFYIVLLLWDCLLLSNRHNPSAAKVDETVRILWRQALPVHVCGLIVCLFNCVPTWTPSTSRAADICLSFASSAALVGIAVLMAPAFTSLRHFVFPPGRSATAVT